MTKIKILLPSFLLISLLLSRSKEKELPKGEISIIKTATVNTKDSTKIFQETEILFYDIPIINFDNFIEAHEKYFANFEKLELLHQSIPAVERINNKSFKSNTVFTLELTH